MPDMVTAPVLRCGRCGRSSDERIMGRGNRGVPLCHANRDGTKSDPDCYHLVTVYGEPMTWLLAPPPNPNRSNP
jgi:hypothetical protein